MVSWDAAHIEIDGVDATAEALLPALGGYGHFTAMQVRDGRVRGLPFHLARLQGATRELFGADLNGERVRRLIRRALMTSYRIDDASVRVNVFASGEEPDAPVSVMVTMRPPAALPDGPFRLKSVPYQRPVPHLKHVGGFAQQYYIRQVAAEGYHEALLTGPDGSIAEGAVTNIGFVDGDTVVWPDAPMLRGITLQVLERELAAAGVPQTRRPLRLADVGGYDGAFVANSRGVALIESIDDVHLSPDAELLSGVRALYEAAPWDLI